MYITSSSNALGRIFVFIMGWLLAQLNLWNFSQWNKWNGEQATMQSIGWLGEDTSFPQEHTLEHTPFTFPWLLQLLFLNYVFFFPSFLPFFFFFLLQWSHWHRANIWLCGVLIIRITCNVRILFVPYYISYLKGGELRSASYGGRN